MRAAVVANGEISDYAYTRRAVGECGFVIACDGGLRHCREMGIVPDLIVGDLDSCGEILGEYDGVPVLKFPVEKDFTDLELALAHVCEVLQNARGLIVFGGFGGRFDHQLANAHVLLQAVERGVGAEMRDERTRVVLVRDVCELRRDDGEIVSLLPMSEVVDGVVTDGLYYPLAGEQLRIGYARGVSNEIVGEIAEVKVGAGVLMVVQSRGGR